MKVLMIGFDCFEKNMDPKPNRNNFSISLPMYERVNDYNYCFFMNYMLECGNMKIECINVIARRSNAAKPNRGKL
jgi:hypothetical protein